MNVANISLHYYFSVFEDEDPLYGTVIDVLLHATPAHDFPSLIRLFFSGVTMETISACIIFKPHLKK